MEEIRQGMDHEDAGQRPSSSHLPRKQEMLLHQRVREIEGEGECSCKVGDEELGHGLLTGTTLTNKVSGLRHLLVYRSGGETKTLWG